MIYCDILYCFLFYKGSHVLLETQGSYHSRWSPVVPHGSTSTNTKRIGKVMAHAHGMPECRRHTRHAAESTPGGAPTLGTPPETQRGEHKGRSELGPGRMTKC